ncbi:NAD(P)H-dependent flavin oxidoreductase [Polymorphum gilvum]|uniref:Nitropropane dioxygenase/trans-enoyl-CoA reductase family protein n=1 Tax=Polymorphum gilvum (strain LMG 25793 / CGMCC 1.9160 / SL003B-26A1) TaxID=991905 RepID=F2J2M1_POLGS|nr:nitronate monooxygenase [Polymorphum gilvum]ADZ70935.1 Nitropropane dioxygenase/trans-enoyl-CoA reductase family protein [Polymorphum gilvum SL003B-26A1]
MGMPKSFQGRLQVPAIASPMFLASGPDLVVETCRAGVVGTFPALNQRSSEGYRDWLGEIEARLADGAAAPYGVNLIVHKSNKRLEADLQVTVEQKVPLVITSLGAVRDVIEAVHSYGGLVFHDVINARHARKAAEAGVDGIIAVCAGAGGHAGTLSPFALAAEIRAFYDGTLVLAGAINTGAQILAARAMGADLAYMGTRFLATKEATIVDDYKQMILDASAADILYTPAISGVNANFLRPSLERAGLDPDNLAHAGALDMASEAKVWKTIWSAGHGTGTIADVPAAGDLCRRLAAEYRAALAALAADPFA